MEKTREFDAFVIWSLMERDEETFPIFSGSPSIIDEWLEDADETRCATYLYTLLDPSDGTHWAVRFNSELDGRCTGEGEMIGTNNDQHLGHLEWCDELTTEGGHYFWVGEPKIELNRCVQKQVTIWTDK